jgi:hypothetical protein
VRPASAQTAEASYARPLPVGNHPSRGEATETIERTETAQ